MSDRVKLKFQKRAVIHDQIWMYFITTLQDIIDYCQANQITVSGFEAFKITGEGIQPSQEHSISFQDSKNCWKDAKEFIGGVQDYDYLYEIWYDGY